MKVKKTLNTTPPKEMLAQQQQQLNQSQNRKTSVWTREKISQLIELYKNHECLWNHWHEAYKSKDKRKRAIEDICTTLNVEKFDFGKKIHNLRNQFNTEMKKLEQRIEEAGVSIDDSNAAELRCKWSHFESLMFLKHVIEPRPGGYQTAFQAPKKMRLKFDFNGSDDDLNVSTVLPNTSGSCNSTNPEDLSQFPYDGNEGVITDDFQSFENEVVEHNSGDEDFDQKYQSPKQQELSTVPSRSFIKSSTNKSQHFIQSSSACSSSRTDVININDDSSIIELNSNNVTVVPSHSHLLPTPSSVTTPVISSITTSNSSNRPESILRDQWDAFGELVANEFRNLNSEISRKHLKRKIMQAMLEVGEEDDQLIKN